MTRFRPDDAAIAAANRVIAAHARRPDRNLVEVELSSWLLGAVGATIPDLGDPVERAHAAMAGAAGGEDSDALIDVLQRHVEDGGEALLASACELAGPMCPDALVAFAEAHPGRHFVGRMLARTSDADRLLHLVPVTVPIGANVVSTVAELMIHARDTGASSPAVERRWAEIVGHAPVHLSSYRDGLLRLRARESLQDAVTLAEDLAGAWGRDRVIDGPAAVLARLVRTDPEGAVAMVALDPLPRERAYWMVGLAWWLDVAPGAIPLFEEVLGSADPDVALTVARILSGTPQLELLDRAVAQIGDDLDPNHVAMMLGPGVFQLRAGGHFETADAVATRCKDALATLTAGDGAAVSPLDLFEIVAGPGPDLVPWGAGPGLP